jgi:surfactin synthase thioesterase subunit
MRDSKGTSKIRGALCFAPRPTASARVLCFPFAGAGAAVFRPWARRASPDLELWAFDYPGRGTRFSEPAVNSIEGIVEGTVAAVQELLDRPYAVVGYSLGALVALNCVRQLRAANALLPASILLCAAQAPHIAPVLPPIAHLADADFLRELQARYGGIPEEILNEPELLELLVGTVRADMTAFETYADRRTPPFAIPLHVLGGEHDATVSRDGITGWSTYTTGPFTQRMVPAGHHFLATHLDALEGALTEALVAAGIPLRAPTL